jgi:SAM-dependent methyltransferase
MTFSLHRVPVLEAPHTSEVSACTICGNRDGNRIHIAREMMFGLRDEFRYLECGNCRCVQLMEIPADMSRYYPENYYSFVPARGLKAMIERRWAAYAHGEWSVTGWLAYFLLGPHDTMTAIRRAQIPFDARVLDVGCGTGWLIRHMKRLGYKNVLGIDPYVGSDLRGTDGVVVLKRSLGEMTGDFDVVMLNHSFEHIADQAGALKEIRRLLGPAGRVLIRIPIADSFAWRHYGVNWMHLDAPRHFFLHSATSLGLLAEQCGLRIVEVTYESNASQFIGSEQYAKDVALVDQRKGGSLRILRGLWQQRKYRSRAEELNRNAQGDWGCFELQIKQSGQVPISH